MGLDGRLAAAFAALAATGLQGATSRPAGPIVESRPRTAPTARAWPEADVLFRRDPRWRGADAAYSIPLGNDRILWLFGDTFIARGDARTRRGSVMIRNSVGIQTGRDPLRATIEFHWRGTEGQPRSYFPEADEIFSWPLHGARLADGTLAVFLAKIRATPGIGLGFMALGWQLALVKGEQVDRDPAKWNPRIIDGSGAPADLVVGTSVTVDNGFVVALAVREPGDHAGFLVRYRTADLSAGTLDAGEWWCGSERGWAAGAAMARLAPARVFDDAAPECSIHHDPRSRLWIHTLSLGFGATDIGLRTAPRIEGPWSPPRTVHRPEESGRAGLLVYAAKAHPELDAGTDEHGSPFLAVTYAVNTLDDFGRLVEDEAIYYPRFVRVSATWD